MPYKYACGRPPLQIQEKYAFYKILKSKSSSSGQSGVVSFYVDDYGKVKCQANVAPLLEFIISQLVFC